LDWRQGGAAVRKWNYLVLTAALFGVGGGLVVSVTLSRLGGAWAPLASSVALWVGLGLPVIVALRRSRPAGLLRVRSIDLLWGLGIGCGLRLLQGWLSGAGSSTFPSLPGFVDSSVWGWVWSYGVPSVLVAPVIEEFLFRAVILVGIYQLLRRSVGAVAAATTALLASAGSFVLLHAAFNSLSLADGIQFFCVGAACGLVVLLSGRIWGAVLTHVVYNVSYLVLAVVGTILA
jgi:membrane protease YdiL (CAAX protease family)